MIKSKTHIFDELFISSQKKKTLYLWLSLEKNMANVFLVCCVGFKKIFF